MHSTPAAELSARVAKLQQKMAAQEMGGALILQNTDLFYFTGHIWPAYLYIPVQGTPLLLNRHRGAPPADLIWPVVRLGKLNDLPEVLRECGCPADGNVGLELDVLPVAVWQRLRTALPGRELSDAGRLIRQVRAVKSPWEIAVMRSYAQKDLALWGQVPAMIRAARTDLELAVAFEAAARAQGQQAVIRVRGFNQEMGIACIAAGEGGAELSGYDVPISGVGLGPAFPFGAAGVPLKPGHPVSIDFGSCYASYILDHTRTFAVGHLPEEAWRAFQTALDIQGEMVSLARPGAGCGELFARARGMAEKAGLSDGFMGAGGGVPFLGHGVGLEVDELPVLARGSREVLEEGMVLAIEPKFALAGIGAVGIENCFAVTAAGLERLTMAPDEVQVVTV